MINMPRLTSYAEFVNRWAIGVETANLGTVAPPPHSDWRQFSTLGDDVAGAKLLDTVAGLPGTGRELVDYAEVGALGSMSRA